MPLFRRDVVAVQRLLVAEVQLAAEDDRVGPGLLPAGAGLGELALFLVRVGRRLDQRDGAASLVVPADEEQAVRRRDRPLADAAVLPDDLARLDVRALQA